MAKTVAAEFGEPCIKNVVQSRLQLMGPFSKMLVSLVPISYAERLSVCLLSYTMTGACQFPTISNRYASSQFT